MKKTLPILIILVLLAVVIFPMLSNDDAYIEEINTYWSDREEFFRSSSVSPFNERDQKVKPLQVFPPNKDFRVSARLNRFTKRETMLIGSSDGSEKAYLKFGTVSFSLSNTTHQLLILRELSFGGQYFVGFGDDTSGDSTYGGGRYLDLVIGKSDNLVIDFNKAYNPYCAYFDEYACPLPPAENLLAVAIKAGEKNYLE